MIIGYLRASSAARGVLALLEHQKPGDLRERLWKAWEGHLSGLREDLDLPDGFDDSFRSILAKSTADGAFDPSIIQDMPADEAKELEREMLSFAHRLTVAIARAGLPS